MELKEWPHDGGAGGRVAPAGEPLTYWVVSAIHARYKAPTGRSPGLDPWGKPIDPGTYEAYLVDLDGSHMLELASYERVLLHQAPPIGQWYLREVDDAYLAEREKYRVDRAGEGA
ncbi:hypothetical protein ACIBEJ_34965 [Nonomuraea sp. NPDC050790]|uniref:hypothetical protein n=1 Tax=Nonomuraea sp. NPDC050790 TaxID=3364371 RepID=UPI0037B42479